MAGYTRQSTFADGDTITAALFNNEYNQLLNAFSNTSGHSHDGTANEGPVIGLIGDAGETAPNNKVLIDTTNNYIEFYVEVSSAPVQQLYIADGAIIPVTDSDIDLGTTSLRFKDTYTDTVTTTGNVSIGGDLTVTGSATISGNLTFGDADTDSINLAAEIDSDIIPNTDGTYDLGSATKEWQDLYIDGTANIDSLVADTADINGGTIDGATIATSDITVGAGKTLDVSAGTLTLADDQISGDKVEGGTIAATTITTLTSTTGNITTVNSTTTNATTVDSTNLEVTNLKAKDGTAAGSIANSTGVVTLASSALTTTDINGGTIDGTTIATSDVTVGTGKTLDVSSGTLTLADNQISGDKVEGGTIAATTITALTFGSLNDGTITVTAFADEDDMSSNSATLLPTQQSVKAYVDSQVTAQDLDFQGDTGGALSIDLDSESLTIAGGTGLDTVGSGNTVTVNIDSTVATLTGSQTLTNKTLTTPIISSISNTGTLTLPTSTDTLVGRATTDTLTNKTLTSATLTSPVINTGVSGTAFLDDDTFATATATTLASSESIKAYVDTTVAATNEVVEDTTPQLGGNLDLNSSDITGTGDINITGTIQSSGNITIPTGNKVAFDTDGATYITEDQDERLRVYVANTEFMRLTNTTTDELRLLPYGGNLFTGGNLDVTGTATMDGLTVEGTGTYLASLNNTAQDARIQLSRGGTEFGQVSAGGNLMNLVASGSSTDMRFLTNSAERMRISSGGDISFYDDTGTSQALFWDASAESLGIGTTSPDYPLHVKGTTNILKLETSTDGRTQLGGYDSSGNTNFLVGSTDSTNAEFWNYKNGYLRFATNSTERFRIAADGSLSTPTLGTSNVRFGVNAGNSIVSGGNYNVLVGDEAGTALTTGDNNVALGYKALFTEDTGNRSVAIGDFSLQNQNNADSNYNVAVGYNSGLSVTTGVQNTLIGGLAGPSMTTASKNTAVGYATLGGNTTGADNVALGWAALNVNTTGASNVALGLAALSANTTASNNTAVGYLALTANTTGTLNTAIGSLALDANTTASENTAIGHKSLTANTTGSENVVVGERAAEFNTTGSYNTAIGRTALKYNTTASNNTAVGYKSLETNTTGASNTAVGRSALGATTTGANNTTMGYSAGSSITTGTGNTFLGSTAGDGTNDGNYNTSIGFGALSGNAGDSNCAMGVSAGLVTTGTDNVLIGSNVGYSLTSGGNNIFLGHDAGRSGSPGGLRTTASNAIVLGDGDIGAAYIQVDWTVSSDQRDKTDFTALDLGLDFVNGLAPVTYKWDKRSKYGDKTADDYDLNAQTPDGTHKEDWLDIGFKAQEVEALEIAAGYNKNNNTNLTTTLTEDGKQYGIQYSKFVPILVKALQEADAKIEALTTRITTLEG